MSSYYLFTVTEELCRSVVIKADSLEEAYAKGVDQYKKEEIVLDASDFVSVGFDVDDYPSPEDCLKLDSELNR